MKNFILLLIFTYIFSSCGGLNTPGKVSKRFMYLLEKEKYEEASKLVTPNARQMFLLAAMQGYQTKKSGKKLKLISEEIEGDTATVVFESDDKSETTTFYLVKNEGRWMIQINKWK